MPNVVNGIKAAVRDGRFTKPPRGPIGKRKGWGTMAFCFSFS